MKTINEAGLNEIKEFLTAYHKKGAGRLTDEVLRSWAADAEFQLAEGNTATIEIPSFNSITGATIEYRISDEGIDSDDEIAVPKTCAMHQYIIEATYTGLAKKVVFLSVEFFKTAYEARLAHEVSYKIKSVTPAEWTRIQVEEPC